MAQKCVERRPRRIPVHARGDVPQRCLAGSQDAQHLGKALAVVLNQTRRTIDQSDKAPLVRRQNLLWFAARNEFLQRGQEIAKRVGLRAAMEADVRRDFRQEVVTRKQELTVFVVEADVSW